MGIFNRKKKEEELTVEFNYEEMMAAAKLHNIFDGCKLYNVFETQYKMEDIQNQYEATHEETELIGVYNRNDKLILVLKYNLEQKILFNYLLQLRSIDYIFDKMDISPLTIKEKDETLLSNYSNSEILEYIKKINEPYCEDETCPFTGSFINKNGVGGLYIKCSIYKTLK